MFGVLAIALWICAARAEEPLAFKGDPLGMTLAEFVQKYRREIPGESKVAPFVYFGSKFADGEERDATYSQNFRRTGTVIGEKKFPFETKRGINDTIADFPASVSCVFYAEHIEDWDLAARHQTMNREWLEIEINAASRILLGEIRIIFDRKNFWSVVKTLALKYGEATETKKIPMETGVGRKFEAARMVWLLGADQVVASEVSGNVEKSAILFLSPEVLKRSKDFEAGNLKKAVSDL